MIRRLLYVAMAVGLLFSFIAVVVVSINVTNGDDLELQMVHIIMRHGIRTPASTYPKDPYINDTFYPVGWGQLTNVGKSEIYKTGMFLRSRYDKFLGDYYFPKEFYAQSTDVDRTKSTLQIVNAALWPPKDHQKWGPIDWQPVPLHSQPLDQDSLLLVRRPCGKYHEERDKVMQSEEIVAKLKKDEDMFKFLYENTGQTVEDYDDVQDIYSTLLAEKTMNLTLPKWTENNSFYPERMFEATSLSYVINSYTKPMIRLKGGVLLKKIVNDWNEKIDGVKDKTKTFLYGGHDSTIVNLMKALDVWETPQLPGYGITILLELSKSKSTGDFGIQVFLRNGTDGSAPKLLVVPGCDEFCPITKLKDLIRDVLPEDWSNECVADDPNYTPPPPAAP